MRMWQVLCVAVMTLASGAGHAQGARTFPVTGRVLQPNGSPAAGAAIEARSIARYTDWKVEGAAISDADGKFTVQLKQGTYYLRAGLDSLVCFDLSREIIVGKDGKVSRPIELRLEQGCKVDGMVVDNTGQPIGGVKILTRDGDTAESSDSGKWTMILARQNHTIIAVKDGYFWPLINFTASGDNVSVKVEMKPGGIIKGTVLDEEGKPIPGVRVGRTGYGSFRLCGANTDAQGRYTMQGLDPDAKVQVWADADGYESIYDRPVTFPVGQREVQSDFTLAKLKYRTISGRITLPDGTPVKGAKVAYADGAESANRVCAWSNKDGNYTIKKAGVARSLVTVTCKDYAPSYKPVEADINANMDFQLKPGHMVEVTVEDAEGKPIPQAGVGAYMKITNARGDEDLYGIAYGASDKNGHFKLDSLPEGEVYATIVVGGFDVIQNERLKVDRTDYTLVLRRQAEGQICGTVVKDSDGKPVTEFNVRLSFSRAGGKSSNGLSPGLVDQGASFQTQDGRFVIKGLTPKEGFAVVVNAPGYMESVTDPVTVVPASKNNDKENVIRLYPAHPFEGAITAAGTGTPIEGVLVTAWNTSGKDNNFEWDMSHSIFRSVSTHTDAGGKFRFESMPFALGTIMLEKPGLARTLLKAVNFRQLLKATMDKGATVTGSIAGKDGKVPPGVSIDLTHKTMDIRFSPSASELRADGTFRIEDLPAGEYWLAEYEEGCLTRSRSYELKRGDVVQVDWDEQSPVMVEGRVVQRGKLVAHALVRISPGMSASWAASAQTGEDGVYSLSLLEPGPYRVSCGIGKWDDPDRINVRREVEVTAGQNRVDLTVPTASISGKLVDRSGKPVANAPLQLLVRETYEQKTGRSSHLAPAGPGWYGEGQCKTDENGTFHVKNRRAGKWMICVDPGAIPAAIVTLSDGEARSGVIAKSPQRGSAKVTPVGMKQLPKDTMVSCVDQYGRVYYPKYVDRAYTTLFENLPVGKLKAVFSGGAYLPAVTEFEVRPGHTALVPIKLTKGPRIVFKPKPDLEGSGPVYISFTVTTPGGKPVLMSSEGLSFGTITAYDPKQGRSAGAAVKPGKYLVKAAASDSVSWDYLDHLPLTGYSGMVTVVNGKDTIVEVRLNK